jgi:hypothetical protein
MDMHSRIVRLSVPKIPKSVSRQRWLLDGSQCTLLTNKARILTIKALIAAITGTVWCTRRLGSNDSSSSLEYRNELEFSLSANTGLQFREDFIPRCRFIHLAYFEEDPNSRTFSRTDLHGYVEIEREH